MNNTSQAHVPAHERIIILIERYPSSATYRIGPGYVIPLLYYRISSREDSDWFLALRFLCALIALRILPAVLRKVLPFINEARAIWIERRQLAKRYDSYQWRKLIWLGIGMSCYVAISGAWDGVVGALTAFCILGGGLGGIFWRNRCAAENLTIE
jgi:hypothetical protein